MAVRLLRVVYGIEFLIALIAAFSVWREVAGQYHLDLLPWYVKLLLAVGLAGCVVKLTAVSVSGGRRKVILWVWIVILFLTAGGLITLYYHLNEPLEDDEDGTTLSTYAVKMQKTLS